MPNYRYIKHYKSSDASVSKLDCQIKHLKKLACELKQDLKECCDTDDLPCELPEITENTPTEISVNTTGFILLAIQATSQTGVLSYQWIKNGISIEGANSSVLYVTNASTLDSGSYMVRVSNPCGYILSNTTELTVFDCTLPEIISLSGEGTYAENSNVSLSVAANNAINYQWQILVGSTWTNIEGATSSSYQILDVSSENSGSYRVVVSNTCGSINGQSMNIIVSGSGLAIFGGWYDADPMSQLVGSDDLTYQWTGVMSDGGIIVADLRGGGPSNKWYVVKYPSSQVTKTIWEHTPFAFGTVPDQVWLETFILGSYKYIVSRDSFALDPNFTITFRNDEE